LLVQLRNYHTGELIGAPVTIDTDNDDLMDNNTYPYYDQMWQHLHVSIGTVSELTVVEVVVNSKNANGDLMCQTLVPNSQATFDVIPEYTLLDSCC